jgi:hypothetical protein
MENSVNKPNDKVGDASMDFSMEFEETKEEVKKIEPAPLQDSKEYYKNTQKMTEAMI